MKQTKLALAALLAVSAVPSFAQNAPASDWTITGNVGLFSDYRFRGISQTNRKPALQGGFDVAHSSGFYLGNWNSNVASEFYNGANLEMDFYGGYKTEVSGFALDLGLLHYYYPGSDQANPAYKIKNTEVYLGTGYGPVTLKVSYPLSDFFSAEKINPAGGNAAGSYYVDLSGSYDLGSGFGLVGHVGYQKLKGAARLAESNGNLTSSYVDWKLGATYTFANGFVAGLSYIDTNRDYVGPYNKKISNGTALLSLSKTF